MGPSAARANLMSRKIIYGSQKLGPGALNYFRRGANRSGDYRAFAAGRALIGRTPAERNISPRKQYG
jgi:hypothetical protein